jgi:hypothetical protein
MPQGIDRIIAERRLRVRGRAPRYVTVRLGMPKRSGGEWVCRFEISGLDTVLTHPVRGTDALQALALAIEAVRVTLKETGQHLTWEGGERGDPGIPLVVTTAFCAAFSAHIERLVERESERLVRNKNTPGPRPVSTLKASQTRIHLSPR